MSITQQHIANRLGVSRFTVSSALSGKGRISEQTRMQVLEAAESLGYRTHHAAQATRSGKTGCIALVASTDYGRSSLPHQLIEGLQSELLAHDLHLILAQMPDEQLARRGTLPKFMRQTLCDGLIINYTDHIPNGMLQALREDPIPSVWINTKQPTDCVYPDDRHGGRIATEALIEQGHRQIAYVDYSHGLDNTDPHYSSVDRAMGCTDAMEAAGLQPRLIRPPTTLSAADRLAFSRRWISQPDRPTAVVCYSATSVAIRTVFAAISQGLNVPGDLAIASIDDHPDSTTGIEFATAVVPQLEMGRQAVALLRQKIADPDRTLAPAAIPFTFDTGHTCVPPGS